MLSKTNEATRSFTRIRGEACFISAEVHRFKPTEMQENANVRGGAGQQGQWNSIVQGGGRSVVEEEHGALESKQPQGGRAVSAIHEAVGSSLDILTSAFRRVLVLMVWFGLPIFNEQAPENITNLVTDFNLGRITDQFCGSTSKTDDILKGINKLFFSLHATNIRDKCFGTNKWLGNLGSVIDCWSVGTHSVSGDGFLPAENIASWAWRLVHFLEMGRFGSTVELGGPIECVMCNLRVEPSKFRSKLIGVRWG